MIEGRDLRQKGIERTRRKGKKQAGFRALREGRSEGAFIACSARARGRRERSRVLRLKLANMPIGKTLYDEQKKYKSQGKALFLSARPDPADPDFEQKLD